MFADSNCLDKMCAASWMFLSCIGLVNRKTIAGSDRKCVDENKVQSWSVELYRDLSNLLDLAYTVLHLTNTLDSILYDVMLL